MNKIYILIIGLLSLLAVSCVKEGGNEFVPDLPAPSLKGFEKAYSAFTHKDILSISPVVENESQYDFSWTVVSTNFVVNSGVVPAGDTIARTKDLSYEVLLNPGQYILALRIKNKQTGVTQISTSALSVSTLTMGGWYLLKEDGGKTDFDFVYPTGRIDNWIANFNSGRNLAGKAIKSVFSGSFKMGLQSTDLYSVFVVISDQDAVICRIDNGRIVMSFDDMFFTKPEVKKPQNVLQNVGDNFIHLINDNKFYTLVKGSFFASPPFSPYKISPVAAMGARAILFDDNSKSMLFSDNGSFATLGANGNDLKNMGADMVWTGGYTGIRGVALSLFRKPTGEGLLFKLNTTYGPMIGSGTLVTDKKTVPAGHGLMSADAIGGNYDSDYIYYAKGNKIYVTDFASLPENLQVTLPEGEEVTSIQHIKYPQPAGAGIIATTDYLAIASYAAGRYKVWLHKISSTGTIQTLAQPTFEGQGRVTCVNYVEQGKGNRTY